MRWHLCSMGRKWRLYWGKLAPLWVYAFSQILCIYVALHFFLTSLMKINIYDEIFEENKYVQKDTLPTKCGILLLRLKWNYSWRSLIRDVALAVAETGSSWCVYSCTLKSVGTDFSTTGLPFLPLLKRQVTSVNMLVLLSWKIGWTGCRHEQAFKKRPPTWSLAV